MLSQLLEWIQRTLQHWQRGGDVSLDIKISERMRSAIDLWRVMYDGSPDWVEGSVHSLRIPSVLAAELARMVTIEMTSELSGKRGEAMNDSYQGVIRNIRHYTEWAAAFGGVCFKPYVINGRIEVDCVQADCFLPVDFDSNGNISGAAFVSRITRGNWFYTRIEWHYFSDQAYHIINRVYRSDNAGYLGTEVPLSAVEEWAQLEPETTIEGLKYPLFSYFKMPFTNGVDLYSPLGVSVYSRAVDLIEQADRQYSRLLWEFEGGELAIDASADALRYDGNHPAGTLPKTRDRLFRGLDIEAGNGSDLYQVFSPALRDESLVHGLNEMLIRIEDVCGFARGTVSNLDHTENARTATELKAMKQRTYALVCDTQKALQKALEGLIYAMDELADLYAIAPAGEIEPSFDFDDSVICDREQEFVEKRQLVMDGIMQPWEFRAWYFGETEEAAKKSVVQSDPLFEETET